MLELKRRGYIHEKAGELLKIAGVEEPPVPVDQLARLRGAQVRYVSCNLEMAGALLGQDDQVVIGVNSHSLKSRQRFTIAHELGHLVLHGPKAVHIDINFKTPIEAGLAIKEVDLTEVEANAFAFELLIPKSFLRRDISGNEGDIEDEEWLRHLADRYNVSVALMAFRLSSLGLTYPYSETLVQVATK